MATISIRVYNHWVFTVAPGGNFEATRGDLIFVSNSLILS